MKSYLLALAMFFIPLALYAQDPGAPDTIYFQAAGWHSVDGETLYVVPGDFPQDIQVDIMTWTDNAVGGVSLPMADNCYDSVSMPTYLDSMKNQYFDGVQTHYLWAEGSLIENFDYIVLNLYGDDTLTPTPPNFTLGGVDFQDSFYAPGLIARLTFTVTDTGYLCLDTIPEFYPGPSYPEFTTQTTPAQYYKPRFGSKVFTISYGCLNPDFSATPVIGEKELEVNFTDLTQESINHWYWSFGDGYFKTGPNPTHTYKEVGSYDVKLKVCNQFICDSIIKEDYIQVLPKPQADFTGEPTADSPPLGVQFTDNSIGNITSWKWYFGDDDSSYEQHPYHLYNSIGTYDVTLIATSNNGSGTTTKDNYIYAYPVLSGDSVKVLNVTALPNQEEVVVPVVQSNDDSLSAIVVPLFFDPQKFQVDSVSFNGSRAEYFDLVDDSIRNNEGALLMHFVLFGGTCLTPGQGLLANLYLSVKDVIPPEQTVLDTSTFTIGQTDHPLEYVNCEAVTYYPDFAPGTLFVEKANLIPPAAPQNLVATSMESAVSLIWDEVTAEDFRFYAIYRDTLSFTPGSLEDTVSTCISPFYLDYDVFSGGTYYYKISAFDSSWNESGYSNEVSVTFGDADPPVITLRPSAIAVTQNTANIYWETDEEADGIVELWNDPDWDSVGAHSEFLEDHTIELTGLLPSTYYEYRVSSTDSLGNGPTYSGAETFTTTSDADETPPQIISGPDVVYKTHNSAFIEWTTDEIADGIVYYGEMQPLSDSIVDPCFVTSHSINLTGLSSGAEYLYNVRSKDLSGNGPTVSGNFYFATKVGPDNVPPEIVHGPVHDGITDNKAVISWLTDEVSTSIVQYGTSELYGSGRTDLDYVQGHQIVLTNLLDSTLYHYRVGSVDPESNGPTWSEDLWFVTLPQSDSAAPIILSGPLASWISDNKVQIDWTTHEISDSWVFYGLGGSYDNMMGSATFDRNHSVILTDLVPDTVYNFYVSSTDPSGNTVESEHGAGPRKPGDTGEDNFRTKSYPDVTSPVIISGPYVAYKTYELAKVVWTTDEASNSIVEYGEDQGYGIQIIYPKATIKHTAYLTNLYPNTVYHFRVGSGDIAKNGPTYSSDVTFTTSADVPDVTPPVITAGPGISYLDESLAIITWGTDEPSNSYMSYELMGALAERIVGEAYYIENHVMVLGLESSYNVQVFSSDACGNGPTYSDYFVVTAPISSDIDPPVVISGPEVIYLSDNTAKIRWETDELSSSFVEYGISAEYSDSKVNPENETYHVVTLTNLVPSTEYHYRIKSADVFANVYLGSDSVFTTEASADTIPPSAPVGVFASYGNKLSELIWDDNTEGDLSGYNFYRGITVSELSLVASNLPDNSYHDRGLVNDVTYYYQVSAVDQRSNESPVSEIVCSRPLSYKVGDYTGDETIDLGDVMSLANYKFKGAEGHEPLEAGDANYDGDINVGDMVYLANYLFKSGPKPCNCTVPELPLARYQEKDKVIVGLTFPKKENSNDVEVLLEIDTKDEIAGLEFDLSIDPQQVEVEEIGTCSRSLGMDLFYHIQSEKVKIGMLDIYSLSTLSPGEEEPVVRIKLKKKTPEIGLSAAKIDQAIIVDPSAQELPIQIRASKVTEPLPTRFDLAQNYPNPFNPRTIIKYSLPQDCKVKISIYNVLGQRVKVLVNEHQLAGQRSVIWDGKNSEGQRVSSGVYFYKIQAGKFNDVKKMLLIK